MFIFTDTLPAEKRVDTANPPRVVGEANLYVPFKVAIEFVLALVLLILSSPLILLGVLLVKATSRGPGIYSQTRIGKDGKPFTIYKLRSMVQNCESLTGAQWSKPGDARVTPVGRWMRKTHIDELPQLWNVLIGDMSLIGPRPERPEFIPQLEKAIPLYCERLHVRPGLTGFAQVQLPPDSDLESVRIKLAYDLYYIRNMSFWFDTVLYLATILKVVGLGLASIGSLCRFSGRAMVDIDYQNRIIQSQKQSASTIGRQSSDTANVSGMDVPPTV